MYLIYLDFNPHLLSKYHSHTATLHLNDWVNAYFYLYLLIFIFQYVLNSFLSLYKVSKYVYVSLWTIPMHMQIRVGMLNERYLGQEF